MWLSTWFESSMVALNPLKKLGVIITLVLLPIFAFASEEESIKVIALFKSSAMGGLWWQTKALSYWSKNIAFD